jgi:hypothetical protein
MLSQIDTDKWNALIKAARYHPQAVESLLTFFQDSREFLGNDLWRELCKTMLSQIDKNRKWNALMMAARYHPQAVESLLTFFQDSREFLGNDLWRELCKTMLNQIDTDRWNALMLAARYHPQAVESLLTFFQNSREFLGNDEWSKLCMTMLIARYDARGFDVLVLAAIHQPQAIKPILDFLLQHPETFNQKILREIIFNNLLWNYPSERQQLMERLTEKLSHHFVLTISKIESDPQKYTWANSLPILFEIEVKNILDIFQREKRSVKMNLFLFNSFVGENAEFILQKIGRDKFCHLFITCLAESVDANDKDILHALRETLNLNTSLAQFFAKHQGWLQIGETTSITMILDEIQKYDAHLAHERSDVASFARDVISIFLPFPLLSASASVAPATILAQEPEIRSMPVSIPGASESAPAVKSIVTPLSGTLALEEPEAVVVFPVPSRPAVASFSLSLFERLDELSDPESYPGKFYDPEELSQAQLIAIKSSVITAPEVSAPEKKPAAEAVDSLAPANKF